MKVFPWEVTRPTWCFKEISGGGVGGGCQDSAGIKVASEVAVHSSREEVVAAWPPRTVPGGWVGW